MVSLSGKMVTSILACGQMESATAKAFTLCRKGSFNLRALIMCVVELKRMQGAHFFFALAPRSRARFEGEYLNGQRHGHGIEVFQDGERWEGTWVADELNGRGSKTLPGGKCLEGRWVDGTFFEDRQ